MIVTNVIQYLHTTAAYQSAALQLMVGEANFVAKQLDLSETVPAVSPAKSDDWMVGPPPLGVNGTVASSNYIFDFREGKFTSVLKIDWFKKIHPPVKDLLELAERRSALDTNTAYQLATQRLGALSVDVIELERNFPPRVFQVAARRIDATGQYLPGISNNLDVPLFELGWGDPSENLRKSDLDQLRAPSPSSTIYIKLLGTTKEVLALNIRDTSLLKRHLQITNADELLGPLPLPRTFVEKLVGGAAAYATIAAPENVEAWLLTKYLRNQGRLEKRDRAGPVKLDIKATKSFTEALLNFDSYSWNLGSAKACIPDYGARLRFTRGNDTVGIRLCYECDILEVDYQDKTQTADFDNAHDLLVKALQVVFPDDTIIKGLKFKGANQQ